MNLFYRKNLIARRHAQTAVWTFTDEGHVETVAEIFVRAQGSLYYYRDRSVGALPDANLLYLAAYSKGICSPRPYHPHLPRDESMFYCVIASFLTCCAAWNLNALMLLRCADAHMSATPEELALIREQARWEDAAIPGTWDARAIRTLGEALDALDCVGLSSRLIESTIAERGF